MQAVPRSRLFRVTSISAGLLAAAALTTSALSSGTLTSAALADRAASAATSTQPAAAELQAGRPLDDRASRDAPRAVPVSASTLMPTSVRKTSTAKPSSTPPTRKPTSRTPTPTPTRTTPASRVLTYDFKLQTTYYYCGPAATRIALSARRHYVSQDELAGRLGTTTNGTDSAADTTRVLNSIDGGSFYRTREIPGSAATSAERDRLQTDVVHAVSSGYAVVANIVGSAVDTDGGQHSFDGGHYLTVVGYRDNGRTVKIADPADTAGDGSYWMTVPAMADWIAQRGYSA